MYADSADPWRFESSEYERQKYAATLAALPRTRYENALEIGCSIGVLTAQLAPRCDALLAVDVVDLALERARRRCRAWPHVEFRKMHLPAEYPAGSFDLVVLSEVGYYWSERDLALARERIIGGLAPGGHLLLVHWTQPSPDYPLTGDRVHQKFLDRPGDLLRHLDGQRADTYRLDLFAAPLSSAGATATAGHAAAADRASRR
ncbi:MAG: SAM-dependent methyltransferase [Thermomicrobiales bacterium]